MANTNLSNAKNAKNDEFYTKFEDIANEINAYLVYNPNVFNGKTIFCPCDNPFDSNFFKYFTLNFQQFKLKKLIATYFASSTRHQKEHPHKIEITQISHLSKEKEINLFDVKYLLKSDKNQLTRLTGDGDFRSAEIKKVRDDADMIITNPPFSLFREFLNWLTEADKQFLIIGSMNAITYKEVFRLIKENRIWLGVSSGCKSYIKPDKTEQKLGNTCWFTNLEHGKRHCPINLLSMKDNLLNEKKLKGKESYDRYDNYNAIEVPISVAIPNDYDGIMGVPISFLEKYSPEQFEIVGQMVNTKIDEYNFGYPFINGKRVYARILIKHKTF
ncbi:MAG: adenine-specific methyltransferase EcoRI family protein [Marinilabiliaceae bacterium]|nr:adenine-specific methyltransferase EcoRI family protein [Marinilabiliaceae bacterium]